MLARPPENTGLLLPLLCVTQKARSTAGFAWRVCGVRILPQPLRGPRGKASHCLSAFCSSLPTTQAMLARPPENTRLLLPLLCVTQKGSTVVLPSAGAEKRIRTSGRVTPVTRFPIVLLKPLRHLCKRQELFYNKSAEKATAFRVILQNFRMDPRKFSHCPSPPCTPHGNMIQ